MERRLKIAGMLCGLAFALVVSASPPSDPGPEAGAEPALAADLSAPGDAPRAVIDALITNNIAAVFANENIDALSQMQRGWDVTRESRKAAAAARGTAEVQEKMGEDGEDTAAAVWRRMLTDEGVESLVAKWQPMIAQQSVETVGQANLALAAAIGGLASNPKLSADERSQLIDLLRATQAWLMRTDWSDPTRLRKAVQAIAGAVRASGVESPDAFQDLEFVDAVARWDAFLRAGKQVAAAYDLPIDEILRSVVIREVSRVDPDATLRYEFTAFGVPASATVDMRHHRGRWMEREMVEHMLHAEAESKRMSDRAKGRADKSSPEVADESVGPMSCGKPAEAELD